MTERQRAALPGSAFVFPERRAFPLESPAAAYDAIRMLRLGRVRSAADFKAVTDAIRERYPAVWKKYGGGLSWPKVKAAKELGRKHRASTVAAKKRSRQTSRLAANPNGHEPGPRKNRLRRNAESQSWLVLGGIGIGAYLLYRRMLAKTAEVPPPAASPLPAAPPALPPDTAAAISTFGLSGRGLFATNLFDGQN